MNTQTKLEVALKQIMQHLASKGIVEPLLLIDNMGNEERVGLLPITTSAELKAWRTSMSMLTGVVSKIIKTELSNRVYILNLNKAGKLMNIHTVLPDGSSELLHKFTIKQDGAMVTVLGNEIAQSHARLQQHFAVAK